MSGVTSERWCHAPKWWSDRVAVGIATGRRRWHCKFRMHFSACLCLGAERVLLTLRSSGGDFLRCLLKQTPDPTGMLPVPRCGLRACLRACVRALSVASVSPARARAHDWHVARSSGSVRRVTVADADAAESPMPSSSCASCASAAVGRRWLLLVVPVRQFRARNALATRARNHTRSRREH